MEIINTLEFEVTKVPCDLCGSLNHNLLYQQSDHRLRIDYDFKVVQCCNCGLAFLNPQPDRKTLSIFYPNKYYMKRNSKKWEKKYENRAKYIEKLPKRTLMDIGCARGDFIHFMSKKGYEVEGYEEIYQGNYYNLTIHNGPAESLIRSGKTYDIITAWAVFEHLTKPSIYFDLVSKLLKKDGFFILLVTNIESLASRYLYSEDIPRHMFFFSPSVLTLYLDKYGMEVLKIFHKNDIYRLSYVNHLIWIYHRLIGRDFHQYNSLLYKIRWQRTFRTVLFFRVSNLWGRFVRHWDQIRKRNGIITAIAKKK